MYDGDQFEADTLEKKRDEAEQSPGAQAADALDVGEDYEEDEDDGLAGNQSDSNTGVEKKGSNPYQLGSNGAGEGQRNGGNGGQL